MRRLDRVGDDAVFLEADAVTQEPRRVRFLRKLKENALAVAPPAFERMERPRGVAQRAVQLARVRIGIRRPCTDRARERDLELPQIRRAVGSDGRADLGHERVPVESRRFLGRERRGCLALHELAFHLVERRERQMAIPKPHDLGGDAEQLTDELVDDRCEVEQQSGLLFGCDRRRLASRGRKPRRQRRIGGPEVSEESSVDPHEAVASIKILKAQTEAEREVVRRHGADLDRDGDRPRLARRPRKPNRSRVSDLGNARCLG